MRNAYWAALFASLAALLLAAGPSTRSAAPPPAAKIAALCDAPALKSAGVKAAAAGLRGTVAVKSVRRSDWGERTATGSATLIGPRLLVTCNHVVEDTVKITLLFHDGSEARAKVAARDSRRDLALLTVTQDAPGDVLVLSDGKPEPGQVVLAIGNPFGYDGSVTRGVVSATGRDIDMPSGETLRGLIQTDAAINPGNSGGPLINERGEVIGIVAAMQIRAQGIGFAATASQVQRLLKRYAKEGQ